MNPRNARRILLWLAIPLALLALGSAGCAKPTGSVMGKVTFRGVPLSNGAVIFYCEGQQIIHGLTDADGYYTVSEVPRGRVRVTVHSPSQQKDLWRHQVPWPPVINGPIVPANSQPKNKHSAPVIPQKYEVPEESGLVLNVDGGVIVFDISLAG